MKKTLLFLVLLPLFSFGQIYTMATKTITLSDITSANGGGSGSVSITGKILTFSFSGGWTTNSIKTGNIKNLYISPLIPNLELGAFYSNGTPTGYCLKIVNNWLVIYISSVTPLLNGGYISAGSISYSLPLLPGIIQFSYDKAGNQTQRLLCINCTAKHSALKKGEIALEIITEDKITYYPNPVKEELNLSWELTDNNTVTSIQVYNLIGQMLKTYTDTKSNTTQVIPFQEYSRGTYMVELSYSDGKQKTFKIIKQ